MELNSRIKLIVLLSIALSLSACATSSVRDVQQTLKSVVVSSTPSSKPVTTKLATIVVPRPLGSVSTCRNGVPLSTSISHHQLGKWNCISLSPDGMNILLGEDTKDKDVRYRANVWRIADNERVLSIDIRHHIPVEYSPDGKYIWGAGTEIRGVAGYPRHSTNMVIADSVTGKAKYWDMGRQAYGYVMSPDSKNISHGFFSVRRVDSFDSGGIAKLWQYEDVVETSNAAFGYSNRSLIAVIAQKGSNFSDKANVALYNTLSQIKIRDLGDDGSVLPDSLIAFSKDDSKVAVTIGHGGVDIYDTDTGSRLNRMELGHNPNRIPTSRALAFSENGDAILVHWHTPDQEGKFTDLIQVRRVENGEILGEYGAKVAGAERLLNRAWDVVVNPTLGVLLITTTDDPNDADKLLIELERHNYFTEIMIN